MKYFKTVEQLLNTKELKNLKTNDHIINQLNNVIVQFDKRYIYNKIGMVYNLINYNVDGDWANRLIESEKYKRDSMSLSSLIARYGDTVGTDMFYNRKKSVGITKDEYIKKHGIDRWNDLRKSRVSFKREHYIEKYGDVEGELRWNDTLNRKLKTQAKNFENKPWKNGRTLDEYQIRYGVKDGYERWQKRNKDQSYKVSLRRYIDEFGEEDGRVICRKVKDNSSLHSFIERYGEDVGQIKYAERCEKCGITLERMIDIYGKVDGENRYKEWLKNSAASYSFTNSNGVSKSSQKLFWMVYSSLSDDIKNNVYFHELNEEYKIFRRLPDSIKLIKLDFKVNDKIIEFDCDYWHNAEEDADRDKYLTSKSYKILRVNYDDFIKDETEVTKKCIDFITHET